ncbi:Threonylcarbamoyl-AMP synthase [compost metagenome]
MQVQPDGTVAILRPGGITAEQLAAVPGVVVTPPSGAGGETAGGPELDASNSPAPRAPGMKYTHYAPQGSLTIVSGSSQQRVADQAAALLQAAQAHGEKTGLLLFEEHRALYPAAAADCVVSLGSLNSLEEGARILYGALRRFDEVGASFILAEACPESGLGAAIMNRLLKAAGGSLISTD